MSSDLIPMDLEKWDMPTINRLVKLRDLERETFDIKGPEFKKLYEHLCAFANYPKSGIIVLGIKEDKPKNDVIGFSKVGFKSGGEDWIRNEINNQMANVDPIPKVTPKIMPDIDDNGRLYPVLKIEGEAVHRPYFVKGSGQCFVRIGGSTSPASRTTVLNLFGDIITKRNYVDRLRGAAGFLKEALIYTCKNIRDVEPENPADVILEVDLTYLKNAALSSETFLAENDLLGGHHNINSLTGGFYSFIHDIERLNLLVKTYNPSMGFAKRTELKNKMQFWEPERQDYKRWDFWTK